LKRLSWNLRWKKMHLLRQSRLLIFLCLCLCSFQAQASTLEPRLQDPAQEQRVAHLAKKLRCMSCVSQSLYESQAPLAQDMRAALRTSIADGMTDDSILAQMQARYGENILLTPEQTTHPLLWLLPFGVLVAGISIALWQRRRV
jgi:cytochrome c-type biogenesis protein CcmH/NrfF